MEVLQSPVFHHKKPAAKDLLADKVNGLTWSKAEIESLVTGIVDGDVSQIQLGAFLAMCFLNPLSDEETFALTEAMLLSGSRFSWPEDWMVVDKHSTGGVGDKISLVLAPALAALGLKVPMISGRGLGLTGGTLDKLEAIPGYTVKIPEDQLKQIVEHVGCCIVGQTSSIVPADGIMYAARDETGTVGSIPLIVGSILSKKLAEGLKALVLEVTHGGMAFLGSDKARDEFVRVANIVCERMGVPLSIEFVDMSSPVGMMIGNALEVAEALDCLQGGGPQNTNDLTDVLGAHLLLSAERCTTLEEGKRMIRKVVTEGAALRKFHDMLIAQGVAENIAEDLCNPKVDRYRNGLLKPSLHKTKLQAEHSGKVVEITSHNVARGVQLLGGSRSKSGEPINHAVGLELIVKVGDTVQKGEDWIIIHHDDSLSDSTERTIRSALVVTPVEE